MKKILVLGFILMFPLAAFAGERPTLNEVKKVLAHYHEGHGNGVFLVDMKLCKDVQKNECVEEVEDGKVVQDQKAMLWMYYFGANDDKAAIHYELKNGGKTRKVGEFDIKGAYRYRKALSLPTDRLGEWEIDMSQETKLGDINLGSFKYVVTNSAHAEWSKSQD